MFPAVQPFVNEWITFGVFFTLILVVIGISEVARIKLKWSSSFNRKFVHVMVGIFVCICPFIFRSNFPPSLLAGIFVVINWLAIQTGNFKGMHSTETVSYGTVFFPFSFLLLTLFFWDRPITLLIAMAIMTFADTGAAIVGENIKPVRQYIIWREKKSVEGSAAMFLISFGIVFSIVIFLSWYTPELTNYSLGTIIGLAGFVAVMATLAEATSRSGSDNLSVPLISAMVFEIFIVNNSQGTLFLFLSWVLLSLIIFIIAYRTGALSMNGAISAFMIGVLIFGAGGIRWITPLIVFFTFSSLLSRIGTDKTNNYQKGSNRDILQVLANGGIPTVIALVNFYRPGAILYLLYLGAIAAATADTWATEIGFFSRKKPRHILTFQPVEKGTSGGITFLGTFGSILGAGIIALGGWFLGTTLFQSMVVIIAGFGGSLIDSLLGGSIQALFVCSRCGKTTERRSHCNLSTTHGRGWKGVDNDMVNLINTFSGALLIFLFLVV